MNILMILDGEFPHDERVEKEALSLISEGNNVFILCLNYGNFTKNETYKGINIIRISIRKSIRNKLQATYLIFPLYKCLWERHIKALIQKQSVNIIHIHDLPLSDIGLRLRKKYPLKVVCDQHELYSSWIVKTAHYNTILGKCVKALSNWDKYEKKCLPEADLVVTVEAPLRDIYISTRQVDSKKIVVLPNTPSVNVFNPELVDQKIIEKYKGKFMLFYAGNIDILRGIDTILESLPLIRNTIPDFKFVLAGRFNKKYYDPLKYAGQLGVSDLVEFLGWIPLNYLASCISASKICIHIPPAITLEVNNSIATKIYQNVIMHKPTIVGQARMMKDFVEKNKIGLSIKESDPSDLAEKLTHLYRNPTLLDEYIDNTKIIAHKYNWEVTSKSFLDHYKLL